MRRYASILGVLILLSGTGSLVSQAGSPGEYDPMGPFQSTDVRSPLGASAFMPLVQLHEKMRGLGFGVPGLAEVQCGWGWGSKEAAPPPYESYRAVGVKVEVYAVPRTGPAPSSSYCVEGAVVKSLTLDRHDRRSSGLSPEEMKQRWLEQLGPSATEGECSSLHAAFSGTGVRCMFRNRPEADLDYILLTYHSYPGGQNSGSLKIVWIDPDEKRARDAARDFPPDPNSCSLPEQGSIADIQEYSRCLRSGGASKN